MDAKFDPAMHLKNLAQDLVDNFARAGRATTPGLVGSARETEIRRQLSSLLPSRMTVSTGCVIDSYGGTSNQADVVIHEKDNCPVFSINGALDVGYIPCEGVAAVGEIKSATGKKEILDATRKIQQVKALQRVPGERDCFRHYGNTLIVNGAPEEALDPVNKQLDQIYGFILCESFSVSISTIVEHYKSAAAEAAPHLAPSMVISLADGILMFQNSRENRLLRNAQNADHVAHFHHPGGDFQYLLHELSYWCTSGRTASVNPHAIYFLGSFRGSQVQTRLYPL